MGETEVHRACSISCTYQSFIRCYWSVRPNADFTGELASHVSVVTLRPHHCVFTGS